MVGVTTRALLVPGVPGLVKGLSLSRIASAIRECSISWLGSIGLEVVEGEGGAGLDTVPEEGCLCLEVVTSLFVGAVLGSAIGCEFFLDDLVTRVIPCLGGDIVSVALRGAVCFLLACLLCDFCFTLVGPDAFGSSVPGVLAGGAGDAATVFLGSFRLGLARLAIAKVMDVLLSMQQSRAFIVRLTINE